MSEKNPDQKKNFPAIFLRGNKPYLWLFLVGFLVYFQSLFYGLTYLDDNFLIQEDFFFIRNLSNIPKAFVTPIFNTLHQGAAYYRPLLTVSFILDSQYSGGSLFIYHFTNIILHLISAGLVFILLKKMNLRKELAFIFSLFFVVHPALAQAVAWIPGRNDSLLAVFVLASLISFITAFKKTPDFQSGDELNAVATSSFRGNPALQSGEDVIKFTESGKRKFIFLHLVFFALAIFAKETALVIPVVIFFYLLLLQKKSIRYLDPRIVFGWLLIFSFWFYLRSTALVSETAIKYTLNDVGRSLITGFPAVILYLGKVFLPFNLSVLPILKNSTLFYGFISLAIVFLALIFSKSKNLRMILFGLLWYLIFLLPSFIQPSSEYTINFMEHRAYLPIIGLILILTEIDWLKKSNFGQKITWIVSLFVLISLSLINLRHSANFKDGMTFWQNAVASSPNHPLAHKNLGAMYYLDGNLEKAQEEFKRSLEINPNEPMIRNNLGLIHYRRKDYEKAEEEFAKEIMLNPNYGNAYFNWGLVFYDQGRKKEAEKKWLDTLKVNPDHTGAYVNLAKYYLETGNEEKADYFLREALKRGADIKPL